MTCPNCGERTVVVDVCESDNECVIRRRKCTKCNYQFGTKEYEVDLIEHLLKLNGVQTVQV